MNPLVRGLGVTQASDSLVNPVCLNGYLCF